MSLVLPLVLTASLAAALPAGHSPGPDQGVAVRVDSSRHEVVVTIGPYDLPDMPPMENHAMMDMGASHDTPVLRFQWPVEGWLRGFRIEVLDAEGAPLPRHIMHHMIMVNFDRRQLLYQAAERLMGAGTETDDAVIPRLIGVPLKAGTGLGLYVAWHNDTGRDLAGVRLRVSLQWTPTSQSPRPLAVMPIYMDVNLTVGATNTYDVPPGRSEKAYEFTMPIGGRLLAAGGHLHDYGVGVRLEDAESGKLLTRLEATRDREGKVSGMERKLFGVSGAGIRLRAGHRYRVIGVYDNPTGEMIHNGAMAHIAGLFAPDDPREWPQIDPQNATFQRDLVSLEQRGQGGEHMDHGDMDHEQHDD